MPGRAEAVLKSKGGHSRHTEYQHNVHLANIAQSIPTVM